MGRLSGAQEQIMRTIIEKRGAHVFVNRLIGVGVNPSRVGYFSSRPRTTAQGGTTFTFSHRWVAKRHARAVPAKRDYVQFSSPRPNDAEVRSALPEAKRHAVRTGSPLFERVRDAVHKTRLTATAKAAGAKWDRRVRDGQGRAGAWYVASGATLPSGARFSTGIRPRVTGMKAGTAAAFQGYVERDGAAVFSVGSIGETLEDRTAYWADVEAYEGAGGRVQARIIAELPWEDEIGAEGRERIVRRFAQWFEESGLPYCAVIHAPEAQSDSRNHHLHLLYHDRPLEGRDIETGEWRMSRRKDQLVSSRDFIPQLRARYAACVNEEYEKSTVRRRYDPRSYAEAGIDKEPSRHLGSAAMALERQGIATDGGAVAVGIELTARLRGARREMLRAVEEEHSVIDAVRNELVGAEDGSSGVRLAARAAAEAAARMARAGEEHRRAMAHRMVAGWSIKDVPRRLGLAAQGGDKSLRSEAAALTDALRREVLSRARTASAAEREAERRRTEAREGLTRARRMLAAEWSMAGLRAARAGVAAAEAAFGSDGLKSPAEWRRRGVEMQRERDARVAERDRAHALMAGAVETAFGTGEKARELVDLARDPGTRQRMAAELRADALRSGERRAALLRLGRQCR